MSQSTSMHGIVIKHDGDVPRGLSYLDEKWNDAEVREIFDNARKSTDQDSHFQAYINGKIQHYILKHTGYDEYFLKPRIF